MEEEDQKKAVTKGGILATVSGIVRSGRVYFGITTNVLSSVGNFAISISLARVLGISELGEFAVAFAFYVFCAGLIRAAVCEPLLAMSPSRLALSSGSNRVSLIGFAFALLLVPFGLVFSMPYIAMLGLALPGLVLFDYSKSMNLAMFDRKISLIQESVWTFVSMIAGTLLLLDRITGFQGFVIWAASGAVIGFTTVLWQSFGIRPTWNLAKNDTHNALAFGGDYIIGSGASQVNFNLIGVVAGLASVGSLRAGGTLLGPVSIVIGSAQTLAIPYLSRGIAHGGRVTALRALASTSLIAVLSIPILAIMAFFPPFLGEMLLGENWAYAEPVLPFLALEMAAIAMTTVPFAGFRALQAGRASVLIRFSLAVIRVTTVVLAATVSGVLAAAIAMAFTSCLGAIVWWSGYLFQLRRKTRTAI
ncbi:hypothetical protein [Paeniglutamicibacter antarcticus]|uniref:hypothetical protein n=1 Tax=Paeniglutamicibacter antarcticus TaxID=494023 RepID=UPI001AE1F578